MTISYLFKSNSGLKRLCFYIVLYNVGKPMALTTFCRNELTTKRQSQLLIV